MTTTEHMGRRGRELHPLRVSCGMCRGHASTPRIQSRLPHDLLLLFRTPISKHLVKFSPQYTLTFLLLHLIFPLKSLAALHSFTFIKLIVPNSIQNHSNAYSLVTLLIKKAINVTLLSLEESIIPWMSPSSRITHTFPNPTFRGRVPRNIRFGISSVTINQCL